MPKSNYLRDKKIFSILVHSLSVPFTNRSQNNFFKKIFNQTKNILVIKNGELIKFTLKGNIKNKP